MHPSGGHKEQVSIIVFFLSIKRFHMMMKALGRYVYWTVPPACVYSSSIIGPGRVLLR